MAKLSKTYEEFVELAKQTKEFESRAHKTYYVKEVKDDSVVIEDRGAGLRADIYLKGIYHAAETLGVENCTVSNLGKFMPKRVAPCVAAFIYATLGTGGAMASLRRMVNLFQDVLDGKVSFDDPRLDEFLNEKGMDQDAEELEEDENSKDAASDEKEKDAELHGDESDSAYGDDDDTTDDGHYYNEIVDGRKDKTFKQMLHHCPQEDLVRIAYDLGSPESYDELQGMKKSTLERLVYKRVVLQPLSWLYCLPIYDLQVLRSLIIDHEHFFPYTTVMPYIVKFNFLQQRLCQDKECVVEFRLCPEVEKALAPFIDQAVKEKLATPMVMIEHAFCGMLNQFGVVPESELEHFIPQIIKLWGGHATKKHVKSFLEYATIAYDCGVYNDATGNVLYYSYLCDNNDWMEEIQAEPILETDVVRKFAAIKAHGEYPNIKPHGKAEQDFYDLLSRHLSPNAANCFFTHCYRELQTPNLRPAKFVKEVVENIHLEMSQANEAISRITNFCNNVPRFYFLGQSPNDKAKQHPVSSDIVPSVVPPLWPKVGRNDPCPCGSGKKFKNCHGRAN